MKQVEIRLNISAVAPLLDVIKLAADDLRHSLAVRATFPEEDADFNETWTQELMAGQNSDVRELLGLFDSDFFSDGSISNPTPLAVTVSAGAAARWGLTSISISAGTLSPGCLFTCTLTGIGNSGTVTAKVAQKSIGLLPLPRIAPTLL